MNNQYQLKKYKPISVKKKMIKRIWSYWDGSQP